MSRIEMSLLSAFFQRDFKNVKLVLKVELNLELARLVSWKSEVYKDFFSMSCFP